MAKCKFGMEEIDYLRHVTFDIGVQADPSKIESRLEWLVPSSLKALRGFLGLTGYYRKIIRYYGTIDAPLIDLMKKNVFVWTEGATQAFMALKKAITELSVLRLPDFP
ncbi:hypothetical protein F2P56_033022 [Juglans regia]|uniref:Mitochondrial protein n=2 Tax=Juglans regia TaxID=51240 RepID=A0A833U024_JUGRE|nr:uncharacterized mitochondrial protein AtMg00860-like [Juglans regia]KAF5447468.1 hypothetical protein F2P56_033022 [Juglans regia]